jgi:hypothetical protein
MKNTIVEPEPITEEVDEFDLDLRFGSVVIEDEPMVEIHGSGSCTCSCKRTACTCYSPCSCQTCSGDNCDGCDDDDDW